MTAADWLRFFREPTSVIFNRTPDGWHVLCDLILRGYIVPTGETDSGGHPLYATR